MTRNESIESFLEKHREFGEEFCALHCIESIEELQEKKDEFFRYIAERAGE